MGGDSQDFSELNLRPHFEVPRELAGLEGSGKRRHGEGEGSLAAVWGSAPTLTRTSRPPLRLCLAVPAAAGSMHPALQGESRRGSKPSCIGHVKAFVPGFLPVWASDVTQLKGPAPPVPWGWGC